MRAPLRMLRRMHPIAAAVAVFALFASVTAWIGSHYFGLKIEHGRYGPPRLTSPRVAPPEKLASLVRSSLWLVQGECRLSSATYPEVIRPLPAAPDSEAGLHAKLSPTVQLTRTGALWEYTNPGDWHFLGIGLWTGPSRAEHAFLLTIPCWCVTLGASLTSILLIRPYWIAVRRGRAGGCPACGYDRSGLPQSDTCPECNNSAFLV